MFEESLLESAHLIPSQSRWSTVAAIALQASVAAVLLAIPVLRPEVLPIKLSRLEFTPPAPRPPTPPPVPRVHIESAASSALSAPTASAPHDAAPVIITRFDPNVHNDAPPATGTLTSMVGTGTPGGGLGDSMTPATSTAPAITIKPTKPLLISRGVAAGLLLNPITPAYPRIAVPAHQEGTVIIHAIISKDGRIESASAISGPVMLQGAALDAVRLARYRPYLLNGQPTEVDTTFNINFRLGS